MSMGFTRLHNWHHENYEIAKQDIAVQMGDISTEEIFGRQVLCAVYVRPLMNPKSGLTVTEKQQAEDVHQGKVMLVLKCGPSAFQGEAEYVEATYGPKGAPKPGDWLWSRATAGDTQSIAGEGAVQVRYEDRHGEKHDAYGFQGWPCRVLSDEDFIGRTATPHSVV